MQLDQQLSLYNIDMLHERLIANFSAATKFKNLLGPVVDPEQIHPPEIATANQYRLAIVIGFAPTKEVHALVDEMTQYTASDKTIRLQVKLARMAAQLQRVGFEKNREKFAGEIRLLENYIQLLDSRLGLTTITEQSLTSKDLLDPYLTTDSNFETNKNLLEGTPADVALLDKLVSEIF